MPIEDIETGEKIINPYIIISSPEKVNVNLNAHTFWGKIKKIRKFDENAYKRFKCLTNRRMYAVLSVIGEPNLEKKLLGKEFVEGVEKKIKYSTELGLISEKEISENFPNAYEFFSKFSKKKPSKFTITYRSFMRWYKKTRKEDIDRYLKKNEKIN